MDITEGLKENLKWYCPNCKKLVNIVDSEGFAVSRGSETIKCEECGETLGKNL